MKCCAISWCSLLVSIWCLLESLHWYWWFDVFELSYHLNPVYWEQLVARTISIRITSAIQIKITRPNWITGATPSMILDLYTTSKLTVSVGLQLHLQLQLFQYNWRLHFVKRRKKSEKWVSKQKTRLLYWKKPNLFAFLIFFWLFLTFFDVFWLSSDQQNASHCIAIWESLHF